MKNLNSIEVHSVHSLVKRFNCLISRTTAAKWLQAGKLKPVMETRNSNNSHLIFRKRDLDKAQAELEERYRAKVKRLATRACKAAAFREQIHAEALEAASRP